MFSNENCSGPPPATNLFWTDALLNSSKPNGDVRFYYGKKQSNQGRHNTQMVVNKTTNGAVISQVSKVKKKKTYCLVQNFSRIDSRKVSNKCHPLVKNLFTGKIPNLQLAGRLVHFNKNWKKLTRDQEILSAVKGYVIPFLRVPVQRTKLEKVTKRCPKQRNC